MPNIYDYYPPNNIMYSDVQWQDPGTQGATNIAVIQYGNLIGRITNITGIQLTFQDFMKNQTFHVTIGDSPQSQEPFSVGMGRYGTGGWGRKSKKSKKSKKSRKSARRSQRKVRR